MPENVIFGRDGSILTVGDKNLLGTFKTCSIRVTKDNVDHSGPQDEWVFRTPRRNDCSVDIETFIRTASDDDSFDLVMPFGTDTVTLTCDLPSGKTFTGDFHVAEVGVSVSDEPNAQSLRLESTGEPTST